MSEATERLYFVIAAGTLDELQRLVDNTVREGWRVQGGVAVEGGRFYQALVKQEDYQDDSR